MLMLFLIIYFVINLFIAMEFQSIAEQKGYNNSSKYFWYTFLLNPYGMLMVVALPDRVGKASTISNVNKTGAEVNRSISDELPDL